MIMQLNESHFRQAIIYDRIQLLQSYICGCKTKIFEGNTNI